jgi:hypothetical protein
MFEGVSKSGAPSVKLMTSTPWLIKFFALLDDFIVADSSTRSILDEIIFRTTQRSCR